MIWRSVFAALLIIGLHSCTSGPTPHDEVADEDVPMDFAAEKALAERGDAGAQWNLSIMYINGTGVPRNYTEALKWTRLAAQQGNVDGQFTLALMYADGLGVPTNDSRAYAWWSMAAAQGDELASKNTRIIIEKMTRQQIAEAQAYAARCFENDYKGCD